MRYLVAALSLSLAVSFSAGSVHAQEGENSRKEVTVTIRELDVAATIREFRKFEERLEEYRTEVSEGQKIAAETAAALKDLRQTASSKNGYNEEAILDAIRNYVKGVVGRQSGLVDFLQSQRYRISYYANKMAASVRPEDVALLFGTEKGNLRHLRRGTLQLDEASRAVRTFIDGLSRKEFDRRSFRSLSGMTVENRRRLAQLQLRYQSAKNALDISRSRLRLVRRAKRAATGGEENLDLNVDLLLSQMFGTLDRIRLQMSMDLLYLETFLSRYERTARTEEILKALQHLVSLQGGLDTPNPGLANVLTWLEESSVRKLSLGLEGIEGQAGVAFPRSSDLLREAYGKGMPPTRDTKGTEGTKGKD